MLHEELNFPVSTKINAKDEDLRQPQPLFYVLFGYWPQVHARTQGCSVQTGSA